MYATNREMVDFIRSIHARPNGTGAMLNLIRASEVRAAVELSALTDVIADDELRLDLTRHASDEARHAYILVRRMNQIGFSPSRLALPVDRTEGLMKRGRARDVKQVFEERGAFDDTEVLETLVVATIAERDALPKLEANFEALSNDPQTQAVIGSILRDETRHVAYLSSWVERFEKRLSTEVVNETRERLNAAFGELSVVFFEAFADYLKAAEGRVAA